MYLGNQTPDYCRRYLNKYYSYDGAIHHGASKHKLELAMDMIECASDQFTIQTTQTDFLECVYPTVHPIPNVTTGKCHPIPEFR